MVAQRSARMLKAPDFRQSSRLSSTRSCNCLLNSATRFASLPVRCGPRVEAAEIADRDSGGGGAPARDPRPRCPAPWKEGLAPRPLESLLLPGSAAPGSSMPTRMDVVCSTAILQRWATFRISFRTSSQNSRPPSGPEDRRCRAPTGAAGWRPSAASASAGTPERREQREARDEIETALVVAKDRAEMQPLDAKRADAESWKAPVLAGGAPSAAASSAARRAETSVSNP
mmetsp:Transcript_46841/g.102416  ORF Transcript_46841/g.102416 Transcript_46841/m.102416 type:complete len:229 (-) Transcript_46841:177-863(-)